MQRTLRQTQTYLQELLAHHGIRPRPGLGQNFLIDLNLQRVLVEAADLKPTHLVLEIGAGTGGLTVALAERAGHVLAVEIDPRLYELARETIAGRSSVTLLHADILKGKNQLNPDVLNWLRAHLNGRERRAESGEPEAEHACLSSGAGPSARWSQLKLVANLPYNVATPIISNLLATDLPLVSMTVTIQQEVADRLMARPRTKDYGSLSVWVQALAEVKLLRRLPPSVFWPRPQVSCAFVQILPDANRRRRVADLNVFHELVRRMFLHRRKALRTTLAAEYHAQLSKAQAEAVLASHGLAPAVRPEELSVEHWICLANDLQHRLTEAAFPDSR